ncbi:MAG: hypothetical protein ACHQT9_00725 [Candidatus Saccharimonadales bacterium]
MQLPTLEKLGATPGERLLNISLATYAVTEYGARMLFEHIPHPHRHNPGEIGVVRPLLTETVVVEPIERLEIDAATHDEEPVHLDLAA